MYVKKLTTVDFINKATIIHGDKYNYSKVNYINSKSKVIILCPKHGEFEQTAFVHLKGGQCIKCIRDEYRNRYVSNTINFIEKSKIIHGDKYDYSKVEYISAHNCVDIICKKHGCFKQTPTRHLSGSGCQLCAIESRINKNSSTTDEFIYKSRIVHGNKYDYSKVEYISAISNVNIICNLHGSFLQIPNSHLNGSGCPECSKLYSHNRLDLLEFINKSNSIHNNKYNYSKSVYINQLTKIEIICDLHGSFWQAPTNHYKGQGCPVCNISVPHAKLLNFLDSNSINYVVNDRKILDGLEIDIWLPDYNFGIEINGCYWHGSNNIENNKYAATRHVIKYNKSIDKNIILYQLWDYEILEKFDLIVSMIKYKMHESIKIAARKCHVELKSNREINDFVNRNHLQGHRNAYVNYCLLYDNKIVSLLSISRHNIYQWEIIRYCSDLNLNVQGGFSKLLSRFIKDHDPNTILTFADCRISVGCLYKTTGFKLINHTKPNYFYYKSGVILSRQKCQKHKINKLFGDNFNKELTETENMWKNGFIKVYDAGHLKLLWTKQMEK